MASITLENVDLCFHVRRRGRVPLKEYLIRRMFRRAVNPIMEVRALQNVSLDVREGDRLGIIGHNGAGKSTLLRLMGGVYPPTSGRRAVEGRISSLYDFTLGFQPEMTGWENIALRGYLQGETPQSVRAKLNEIAEFSELGEFLDMPVRHYSSGMLIRLGFSISTAIEPEILLIDEVLSAGDLAFQNKARRRMKRLIDRAQMMALVSHDLEMIASLCNRLVWMESGRVRQIGKAAVVLADYRKFMLLKPEPQAA